MTTRVKIAARYGHAARPTPVRVNGHINLFGRAHGQDRGSVEKHRDFVTVKTGLVVVGDGPAKLSKERRGIGLVELFEPVDFPVVEPESFLLDVGALGLVGCFELSALLAYHEAIYNAEKLLLCRFILKVD